MKTKLQTIRQACIEANPEIVELKFGCEFESKGEKFIFIRDDGVSYQVMFPEEYVSGFARENDIKIIGRPITLADVLMAVKEADNPFVLDVKANGDYFTIYVRETNLYPAVVGVVSAMDKLMKKTKGFSGRVWNLALPLSGQSEETLDFIIKILEK